jgi:hypothetical protein
MVCYWNNTNWDQLYPFTFHPVKAIVIEQNRITLVVIWGYQCHHFVADDFKLLWYSETIRPG